MGLEPGRLDRQIVVQQLTESIAPTGFPVESWQELDTVWANKRDLRGSERYAGGQQLSSPFDTLWTLHYRADLDPELIDVAKSRRVLYQNRSYDVVYGRHLGVREGIELMTLAKGTIEA